jgi:hypothetical protein
MKKLESKVKENNPLVETRPIDEDQRVSLDMAVNLHFEYLKQLGTIALMAAGGLMALAQFAQGDKRFFLKIMLATALMLLSALLSFLAQIFLMDRIRQSHSMLRQEGRRIDSSHSSKKLEKRFEGVAIFLLCISIGMAFQALIRLGLPA